jgi:hypothetical protein
LSFGRCFCEAAGYESGFDKAVLLTTLWISAFAGMTKYLDFAIGSVASRKRRESGFAAPWEDE